MKRLLPLLITLVLLAVTAAGGIWLTCTESGLGALARLAVSASGRRLSLDEPSGRLIGPLGVARVSWSEPGTEVVIEGLRIDWAPGASLEQRLSIAELAAARVAIEIAGSDEASAPPSSLRLPLAVDVKEIVISRLDYGKLFSAGDLHAAYAGDTAGHRLTGVRGRFGKTVNWSHVASAGGEQLHPEVRRINVKTGINRTVAVAPLARGNFVTHNQGAVRFASGKGNDQKFKVFYRADDKADWELIIDEADEGKFSSPLRFNRSGNGVYFSCPGKRNAGGLCLWDVATRTFKTLWSGSGPSVIGYEETFDEQDLIAIRTMPGRIA